MQVLHVARGPTHVSSNVTGHTKALKIGLELALCGQLQTTLHQSASPEVVSCGFDGAPQDGCEAAGATTNEPNGSAKSSRESAPDSAGAASMLGVALGGGGGPPKANRVPPLLDAACDVVCNTCGSTRMRAEAW